MFTEDDLRATLGALEDEAPDTDRVLAGLDRVRRRRSVRRRTFGTVATAVLAAVVTGGSILVATPDHTASPPSDLHLERLRFPFAVLGDIPGHRVVLRGLNENGMSSAEIDKPENIATGNVDPYVLRVFEKGRYNPTVDPAAGQQVAVDDKPGVYSDEIPCQCPSGLGVPSLLWEYAPDSWALIQYQRPAQMPGTAPPADVREFILTIAAFVTLDRTTPLPIPFRIGYLPAGLRPAASGTADANTAPRGAFFTSLRLVAPGGRTLTIEAGENSSTYPVGEPHASEYCNGDQTQTVCQPGAMINLGQSAVRLTGSGYSAEELKKVASSMKPAKDLHDPSTWFDATRAIAWR